MLLVKVTLDLGDNVAPGLDEQVHVDLPAVPRIGEEILWCDEATSEHGTYDRMRKYRVQMVHWTMSAGEDALILVQLDFVEDISGGP